MSKVITPKSWFEHQQLEARNNWHFFYFSKKKIMTPQTNFHFVDQFKRKNFKIFYHKNLSNIRPTHFYTNRVLQQCATDVKPVYNQWNLKYILPHRESYKANLGKGEWLRFFFNQSLLKYIGDLQKLTGTFTRSKTFTCLYLQNCCIMAVSALKGDLKSKKKLGLCPILLL